MQWPYLGGTESSPEFDAFALVEEIWVSCSAATHKYSQIPVAVGFAFTELEFAPLVVDFTSLQNREKTAKLRPYPRPPADDWEFPDPLPNRNAPITLKS